MENREIDRLIIEKVLELPYQETEPFGLFVVLKERQDATLFRPSSNIQDAWIVLDKFEHHLVATIKDKGYYCEILKWRDGAFDLIADQEDKTAPLAICKAALEAKGIDI